MKKAIVASVPHSWAVRDWPLEIFPGSSSSARWLIRCNKPDLIAAGALVRVGRQLVVIGNRYARWLERQASEVADFEIAPNRKEPVGEAKEGQQ